MVQMTASETIQAPLEDVWDTIAHIENYRKAVPHIVAVEFLTEQRAGVGTRFRETRMMGKRQETTDLEVTEYVENERIRIVTDSHGTVWDTVFTVGPAADGGVRLKLVMDARAHKLLPKLLNPIFRIVIEKTVAKDLVAVKEYLERRY